MRVTQLLVLSFALLVSGLVRETESLNESEFKQIFFREFDRTYMLIQKMILPPDLMERIGGDWKELSMTIAGQIFDEVGIETLMKCIYDQDSLKKLIDTTFIIAREPMERFSLESKIFLDYLLFYIN